MCVHNPDHLIELVVVRVQHIDVPCTAELDISDSQFGQHIALGLEVGVDLVGKS
ncbi:MAG: hypothetical protein ABJD68_14860 [Nakamurella sp.]